MTKYKINDRVKSNTVITVKSRNLTVLNGTKGIVKSIGGELINFIMYSVLFDGTTEEIIVAEEYLDIEIEK